MILILNFVAKWLRAVATRGGGRVLGSAIVGAVACVVLAGFEGIGLSLKVLEGTNYLLAVTKGIYCYVGVASTFSLGRRKRPLLQASRVPLSIHNIHIYIYVYVYAYV